MSEPPVPVLLGLGANLDDPVAQLGEAVRLLGRALEVTAVSSVYRSEPVGYRSQPDFFNLALQAWTRLAPERLLMTIRGVEDAVGRTRTFRNAPRRIDVDLLAYGDRVLRAPGLTIPHPRLHERAFVLIPLAEVAPEWRHPILGLTPAEMLAEAGPLERIERWGPLPDVLLPLAPAPPGE